MAVLKVLGFRPVQILLLILGEALLVGGVAGFVTGMLSWAFVTVDFQIGFFPGFRVPIYALFWGLAMGFGTSLLGSLLPAWTASSVKVSEVFAKVA
jgi:putative ABC transport system permease protein